MEVWNDSDVLLVSKEGNHAVFIKGADKGTDVWRGRNIMSPLGYGFFPQGLLGIPTPSSITSSPK